MNQESRKKTRVKVRNCITNTPAGLCQLLNINSDGLSLKCFKKWSFSREWSLDIYDTSGLILEQFQVKKIWEKCLTNPMVPGQFSMIVGVAFHNLSGSQKEQLDSYVRQLIWQKKIIFDHHPKVYCIQSRIQ